MHSTKLDYLNLPWDKLILSESKSRSLLNVEVYKHAPFNECSQFTRFGLNSVELCSYRNSKPVVWLKMRNEKKILVRYNVTNQINP